MKTKITETFDIGNYDIENLDTEQLDIDLKRYLGFWQRKRIWAWAYLNKTKCLVFLVLYMKFHDVKKAYLMVVYRLYEFEK